VYVIKPFFYYYCCYYYYCLVVLIAVVVVEGFWFERLILGRLYALQKGMEIDRKSPDCRSFLSALMNLLEEVTVIAYTVQ